MGNKIRVLECIRQGKIGGGESHLLNLVEYLDKSRFEPVVLSFTQGPMIDRLQQMGVGTDVIYTEKPFDLTKWRKVKELLKEKKVDLIHAHGTRAASNVLWAARSLGIPVVYTIHGWSFHPDQQTLLRRMRIAGETYITSRTAVNISVSRANQVSGKQHIKGFESVLVNYGIDQKKFSPSSVSKDVRVELGIGPDALLVLFIARFTKQKQPLAMIRAFKEAADAVPGMHLLMVGDGELREEALRLSADLGLGDRITFQTFRQDVPDVLAAADIFVLPSLWEGLPIGLLEAMAMGKAIIASDVDGTGEVLKHRENGLLVQTGELVPSLTEALVQLGHDREMQKKFQQRAIETISGRFNVIRMAREIEDIYTNVLNKPLA
ncbi:glycosyltransferase family 4 protein [Puia dinghuensis]|uniref:Glycosyl transferase family 1 n=1 Tax=Puia dinghuensis TaxID=1792502 RepID=A0A8J2XV79_9BACT|nr:glycosyltransferase family 4 protein [Puia dinghuensis]GGB16699.1 glycosyl transferase family 1 [Puia dinghuensis]